MAGPRLERLLLARGRLCRYGPGLYVRESHSPERAPECAGRTCNAKPPLVRRRLPSPGSMRQAQSRAFLGGSPMRAAHAASASGAMPRILPGRFLPNRPCGPSLRVRASRSRTAEWAAHTSLPIWRIARPLFLRQAASSVIFWLAGLFFAAGTLQPPQAGLRHEAILGWSLLGLPLFPV